MHTSYVVAASELKASSYTVKRPKTYAYNDQVLYTYMLYLWSYIPVTWQFLTREWLQHAGINGSHDVSLDGYQLECNIMTIAKCFKPAHIFNSPNFHVFLSNHNNTIRYSAHQQICRGISLSVCRLTYNDSMYHYSVIKYKNTQKLKLKFTFSVPSESELEDA